MLVNRLDRGLQDFNQLLIFSVKRMNDTCRIMESDRATMRKPFSLIGADCFSVVLKSGTTLLLSLLDSHPQLVVLPEETFYLEDRRHYAALDSYQAKLRRLLEKTDLQLLAKGRFEPKRECPSSDARDYTRFDYQRFVALAEDFIKQPGMKFIPCFSRK